MYVRVGNSAQAVQVSVDQPTQVQAKGSTLVFTGGVNGRDWSCTFEAVDLKRIVQEAGDFGLATWEDHDAPIDASFEVVPTWGEVAESDLYNATHVAALSMLGNGVNWAGVLQLASNTDADARHQAKLALSKLTAGAAAIAAAAVHDRRELMAELGGQEAGARGEIKDLHAAWVELSEAIGSAASKARTGVAADGDAIRNLVAKVAAASVAVGACVDRLADTRSVFSDVDK